MSSSEKNEEAVAQRVRAVIARELDVSLEETVPEASLVEHLGADSLDLVELMMALEDAFDTVIPDEEARQIRTVQQAIDFVQQLLARQEGQEHGS